MHYSRGFFRIFFFTKSDVSVEIFPQEIHHFFRGFHQRYSLVFVQNFIIQGMHHKLLKDILFKISILCKNYAGITLSIPL